MEVGTSLSAGHAGLSSQGTLSGVAAGQCLEQAWARSVGERLGWALGDLVPHLLPGSQCPHL